VGVNNRDLRTFVTDLASPSGWPPLRRRRLLVTESGIATPADVPLDARRATAMLVGESLMRQATSRGDSRCSRVALPSGNSIFSRLRGCNLTLTRNT
jgi:indole-3-glycerol phosphate synthase